MAILNKIGKAAMRGMGSRTALGVLTAGAVVKGLSDTIGKSAIDNAMDIAFDNREADRMVLGTDLTPGLVLAESSFGPISSVARDVKSFQYGIDPGGGAVAGMVAGTTAVGGSLGLLSGATRTARASSGMGKFKAAMGTPVRGAIGAAVGAGVGLAAGTGYVGSYARNNQQLISQSPFANRSTATADALNASGDIVLGMHNSRRGY
jgi:hypothetical protein